MSNENKAIRPKYTLEFKQDAAQFVIKNGYTQQRAADHLGVSLSAIGRRVKAEKRSEGKASSPLKLSAQDNRRATTWLA